MSEQSGFLKITKSELFHSALNAVVAAVIIGLAGVVGKEGFDVFSADWAGIAHMMLNWAFAAFVGSVGKKLMTTKEGNFLGVIGKE